MEIIKRSLVPVLGALLLASACNVSTAHISSVKLGKDKAVTQESATFAPTDTIYAVAEIGNAGKTKDKGQLVVVDVAGQPAGPIAGLEATKDLESSGSVTFDFSPPTAGWPAGKYKLDVTMMDESGATKGQQSKEFTVQ
jgi:hypothetical protein